MSEPDFRPLITGDPTDDDAAIFDDYFVEVDNAPAPYAGDPVTVSPVRALPPTQLLTGTYIVSNVSTSALILPPNPLRQKLQLNVFSLVNNTDGIYMADDQTKLEFEMSSARLQPFPASSFVLDGHTGPVYVKPVSGNVGSVYVSWVSIVGKETP